MRVRVRVRVLPSNHQLTRNTCPLDTIGEAPGTFAQHSLHTRDLLRELAHVHQRKRVVLDPRHTVAQRAGRRASAVAAPPLSPFVTGSMGNAGPATGLPSMAEAFGAGLPGTDAFAVGGSPVIRSESLPVGPHAVDECFPLAPALQAGREWRGPLAAPRDSPLFELVTHVVSTAQATTRECHQSEDVADSKWLPGGAALARMLDDQSHQGQQQEMVKLGRQCQCVLQAQPTLVRVAAPAKAFGDVHGQLRDSLLPFGECGFPSHLSGGDVEATACQSHSRTRWHDGVCGCWWAAGARARACVWCVTCVCVCVCVCGV